MQHTDHQNHLTVLITDAAAAAETADEVNQPPASSLERQIGELKRKLKEEKCHSIELINKLAAESARKMLAIFLAYHKRNKIF